MQKTFAVAGEIGYAGGEQPASSGTMDPAYRRVL